MTTVTKVVPIFMMVALFGCDSFSFDTGKAPDTVGYMVNKLASDTGLAKDEFLAAVKQVNSQEYKIVLVKAESGEELKPELLQVTMNDLGKERWHCTPIPNEYSMIDSEMRVTEYLISCSRIPESLLGGFVRLVPFMRFLF